MRASRLRVLAVAAEPDDADFVARVLEDHGDEVVISDDVMDALSQLTRAAFDVVMISLSLPRGDGLALVHHVRALYPSVDVIVMSTPQEIEETAHAIALGVLQSVLLPLTGDAVIVAADRARERRILVADRAHLAQSEALSRRRTATYARCAAFVAETTPLSVASRILDACAGELPLRAGAIYAPIPGAEGLGRLAVTGDDNALPRELGEDALALLDPTVTVHEEGGIVRVAMIGEMDVFALALLVSEAPATPSALEGLEVVAALGTAAFAAARKVDAIARMGIKDPDTSAYTFAYFGDVAGREIDRAARHGRRFGLLTLGVAPLDEAKPGLGLEERIGLRRAIADAVLESIRDSDVLARVEDDEYYLLLPETALLGAHAARRRILRRLTTQGELSQLGLGAFEPTVGVAIYPADGADLGRLLRVSRRRADRARRGPFRCLGLGGLSVFEIFERLLSQAPDSETVEPTLGSSVSLSRALVPRIVAQVTADALRARSPGTVYVAGDDEAVDAVAAAFTSAEAPLLRAWVLGRGGDYSGPLRLDVRDPRIDRQVFFLSMTELGGYLLVGRTEPDGSVLAYHSSDLDLVDGVLAALQTAYHLQQEVA